MNTNQTLAKEDSRLGNLNNHLSLPYFLDSIRNQNFVVSHKANNDSIELKIDRILSKLNVLRLRLQFYHNWNKANLSIYKEHMNKNRKEAIQLFYYFRLHISSNDL